MFDNCSDEELVSAVISWAEDQPEFDTTFVESLSTQIEKRGELTEKQRLALESIALKWKINVDDYL